MTNEQAKELLENNPTNWDLYKIIAYTDLKKEAAAQLLNQNPTNGELVTILRDVEDSNIRQEAVHRLRQGIGVPENIDEDFEMKRIAQVVTANPYCLDMSSWHCDTTHCIAGHLCILNEQASELEKKYGTAVVAAAFLPSYVPMFYTSNEEALKFLKSFL